MSEKARSSSEEPAVFPLLNRRSFSASVFFSGSLCGGSDHSAKDAQMHLHLLRRGSLCLQTQGGAARQIDRPSLIFFPRAQDHRLEARELPGAELVCARLTFTGPEAELLLLSLPDLLVIPLDAPIGLGPVVERLFDEAFTPAFGHDAAVDLIAELLLVLLLRHCIAEGLTEGGLLAGLGDAKLARALVAMHDRPAEDLNIEQLAAIAGMSRSNFAAAFKQRVGTSPGDYLATLRLALAKQALLQGTSLKTVAPLVGYRSATALARVFQRQFGCGPRDWLAQQQRSADPGDG